MTPMELMEALDGWGLTITDNDALREGLMAQAGLDPDLPLPAEEWALELHAYLFPENYPADHPVVSEHPHFTPGEDDCYQWRASEDMDWIAAGLRRLLLNNPRASLDRPVDEAVQNAASRVEVALVALMSAVDGDEAQAGEIMDATWRAARATYEGGAGS